MSIFDESDKNDYFENSEVPETPPEPKKPVYKPDDPRYWEEPENEFEHLIPRHRLNWKLWAWLIGGLVVVCLLWWGYIRVFNAYEQGATQYGYVEQIEKYGDFFRTYEGVLLPYKSLMDTTRVYEGDFAFSTRDPKLAARLKQMQYSNLPVRVQYNVYHTCMPWRGNTRYVITAVDSVNPRDILPPDRQPEFVRAAESAQQ